MSEFGNLLHAARKSKGLSEWDLSQAVGVSPHAILDWESGKARPKVLQLVALRDVFGEEVYTDLVRALSYD